MPGRSAKPKFLFPRSENIAASLYQLLFEQISIPCWVVDTESLRILKANKVATLEYNISEGEFEQLYYPDLHPEEERKGIANKLKKLGSDKTILIEEWHHIKKPDIRCPISLTIIPVDFSAKTAYLVYALDTSLERLPRKSYFETLRSILNQIPEGIIITDEDGKILLANQAALKLLNLKTADIKQAKIKDVLHLSDPITQKSVNIEKAYWHSSPTVSEHNYALEVKGQPKIPVAVTHTLGTIERTKGINHLFLLRDRTCEEAAFKALKDAHDFFEKIAFQFRNPILVVDHECKVTFANQAFYKIFNTIPDSVIGMELQEIAEGAWAIPDLLGIVRFAISNAVYVADYKLKWTFPPPTGNKILQINIIPFQPPQNSHTHAILDIEDVTEAELASAQAEELRRRYQQIAEIITDAAFEVEVLPNGAIKPVWVSHAFAKLIGDVPEHCKPEEFFPVVPEDRDTVVNHLATAIRGEKNSAQFRIHSKTHKNHVRWIQCYVNPVKDPTSNRVIKLFGACQDITERKTAERQLQHLVLTLKAIREVNQLIVSAKDKDTLMREVCKTLTSTKGYTSAILILANHEGRIEDITISGELSPSLEVLKNARGAKLPQQLLALWDSDSTNLYSKEARAHCPATSTVADTMIVSPIIHGTEKFGLLVVCLPQEFAENPEEQELIRELAHDIAIALHNFDLEREKEEAQNALKKREEELRTFFENAHVGFYRTTPDGQILMANPALARMLGYTSTKELCEFSIWNFYPNPEDRHKFLNAIESTSILPAYESIWLKRDGTPVHVIESAVAVRDRSGKTLYYEGCVINVTPMKEAQAEISRLAMFPELLPLPIFEIGSNGNVIYINPTARETARKLGLHRPEELLPNEFEAIAARALETDTPEINHRSERGGRTFAWGFYPIKKLGSVHCYGLDITEDLKLRRALEITQRLEAVGQLAAGVAHDFNNLLTVIQMATSVLIDSKEISDQSRQLLHEVIEATERGANLTRQLLTFSRRVHKQPKYINLTEVVVNLLKLLQRLIPENIKISLQTSGTLPAIYADPGMIEQVITNLVTNARDAMPEGGTITIALETTQVTEEFAAVVPGAKPGRYVKISVSDTGTGIPPEIQSRIFDPFFTTKEPGKGSGMGLAVTQSIVQQHEGFITFETQVGKGTTFHVFFPAIDNSPEALQYRASSFDLSAFGGSESVLLVEDDASVRTVACLVLRRLGYQVYEASSGPEAIQTWEAHNGKFDLMISDLVLPGGMSGRELADKLRSRNSRLKVIYMTGYSEEVVSRYLEFVPGENLLHKPFQPSQLAEIVRRTLDMQ